MSLGILLPGWDCPACQAFNGEAKAELLQCRCCGEPRPRTEERTMLENLTATQERCNALLLQVRGLKAGLVEITKGGFWLRDVERAMHTLNVFAPGWRNE